MTSRGRVHSIFLGIQLALLAACGTTDSGQNNGASSATTGGNGGTAAGGGLGGAAGVGAGGSAGTAGTATGGSGGSASGGNGGASGAAGAGTGGASGGAGGTGGIDGGATGGSDGGAETGGSGGAGEDAGTAETCPLPDSFAWTSTGELAQPQSPPGRNFVSLKDFTVARVGDRYAIYATAFDTSSSWTGVYIELSEWSELGEAEQVWLDDRATVAPQLMYFAPKDTWVLTYQWGFQYATSDDPTDPTSWSQGRSLLTGNPAQGQSMTGPIDQTVICDDTTCYLFFAADNGRIYRGSMPIESFPAAFTNSTEIMRDTTANLFEAVEVYSIKGADSYLMIVEAMGAAGRYFRAFTADDLGGTFTAMPDASTEAKPFAGRSNVTFEGSPWTNDISHGDLVRDDPSEKKPIDPCKLELLYQGRSPTSGGAYERLPYRPGLLTLQRDP